MTLNILTFFIKFYYNIIKTVNIYNINNNHGISHVGSTEIPSHCYSHPHSPNLHEHFNITLHQPSIFEFILALLTFRAPQKLLLMSFSTLFSESSNFFLKLSFPTIFFLRFSSSCSSSQKSYHSSPFTVSTVSFFFLCSFFSFHPYNVHPHSPNLHEHFIMALHQPSINFNLEHFFRNPTSAH